MSKNNEFYKIVLIGEAGVGKTCIINQYINQKFDPNLVSSSSGQSIRKTVTLSNNKDINFSIFDTAGQERFRALARIFYKEAHVVILVYDITSSKSFQEIKDYWYGQVKETCGDDIIIAIAASKSDLNDDREVQDEEGEKFAKEIGSFFIATSAKNDTGIIELFDKIGKKLLDPNYDYSDNVGKKANLGMTPSFKISRLKSIKTTKEIQKEKKCCHF